MFFDITIVGAGVVGLSIAKSCSESGMSVVPAYGKVVKDKVVPSKREGR